MLSKQEVEIKEEEIRKLVRELPDDKRSKFFQETEKQLKDPDTYAVLNYIFIAGLHHFYLGKWERGLINIIIFWSGIFLLFTPYTIAGILIIIAISLFELYELFQSQTMVQAYNNNIMEDIYNQYKN